MTIQAQTDLPKDESIFRTIVKEANTNLGSYASVLKPGEVRVGDLVELI
jgi:MOSC domain-containing protein YiiM